MTSHSTYTNNLIIFQPSRSNFHICSPNVCLFSCKYENDPNRKPRKARKQNIMWFNPPFSKNVKTNIDREFLCLLAKHFPPHRRLHEVCNKNNTKVRSYNCMSNMAAIISRHNKKLLSNRAESACITPPCNCRNKTSCPLKGNCCKSFIIYKATLKSGDVAKHYYGCCETEFKTRFYNHNQSFKFRWNCNATKLSKAFWQLKDTGQNPCIEWSIVTCTTPYHPGAKGCNLCLSEKLAIF